MVGTANQEQRKKSKELQNKHKIHMTRSERFNQTEKQVNQKYHLSRFSCSLNQKDYQLPSNHSWYNLIWNNIYEII